MWSARLALYGCLVVLIGGALYQAFELFRHEARTQALETTLVAVPTAITRLERAIGYGGLVHNFKNYVLRPDELRYRELTEHHADLALEQVDRLEGYVRESGVDLAFDAVREMIAAYRDRLNIVATMALEGTQARTIDARVRYNDEEALREIDRGLDLLTDYYSAALREEVESARNRSLAVFLLGLITIPIGLVAINHNARLRSDQRMLSELHRLVAVREEEIGRSKLILDRVFAAVRGAVLGLDGARRVVIANPAAQRLLGEDLARLPAPWPVTVAFASRSALTPLEGSEDPITRAIGGETLDGDVYAVRFSCEAPQRHVRVSATRVDDEKTALRTVVVLEDVTDEERQRQQAERTQRLNALGQLTGGIAHDFNNMLGTMRLAVDVAERSDEPKTWRSSLSMVSRTVQNAAELTARLLAFGTRQAEKTEPVGVKAVVDHVLALTRNTLEASIMVNVELEDDDLVVLADSAHLENAILNLMLNARDAITGSGRGDRILVQARTVSRPLGDAPLSDGRPFVDISVSDNGAGMPADVQERALDPFFTTKEDSGGSGLGLSMVYGFVQQAKGDLKIYSEPGVGTTIRMLLPKAKGDAEGSAVSQDEPAPLIEGNGETILIVEDKLDLLEATEHSLISLNYRPIASSTPAAALDVLGARDDVDLLLTDVVMPGPMNGFALARKARELRPDLRLIYMSGYAGGIVHFIDHVDAPLLQKPCTLQTLALIIHDTLGEVPGQERATAGRT